MVHPNAVKLMLKEGIEHKRRGFSAVEPRKMQENVNVAVPLWFAWCALVYAKHVEEWAIPDPAKTTLDEPKSERSHKGKRRWYAIK